MKSFILSAFVLGAIIVGCVPQYSAQALILEPGFETETIATGLTQPTAMAFAPDGRIFIAEKGGSVRVVKNGLLLPDPVITLSDINSFGDRGLIGLAVDPQFLSNGYLYLSYTYENSPGANIAGEKTGRIVRVTVDGDVASESSKLILVGSVGGNALTPSCDNYTEIVDCIPSDSLSHSVGGLRFGPDGMLYATTGDGASFDYVDSRALRAQNLDSLAGKVLRLNPDGSAPSDNPFYNGDSNANRSKVYAYGVRNAFRLNFHPVTGALFVGDVGWSSWEEINHVESGKNFGWPCKEGVADTTYNCVIDGVATDPLYTYLHNSSGAGSVTIGAFASNDAYPDAYDTTLFVGDYAQNWLKRIVIDETYQVVDVQDFDDSPDGPVDVTTGPDGNVYYLAIYSGELRRITHTDGNRHPIPEVSATPSSGLAPLTVNFSSVGSIDPDGDTLSYSWDFGDGNTSTLANPVHEYLANGSYLAVLTLTDSLGSSASKSVTVTVGNQAPTAVILSPNSGALYTVGQTIQLQGSGVDVEDGTLDANALHWEIILHHNTHTHLLQTFDDILNPVIIGPDHNSSDVYLEVILTVTDSANLTHSKSINLYLNNGSASGNLVINPSLEMINETTGYPLSWLSGWYGNLDSTFTYPAPGLEGDKAASIEVTRYVEGSAKWYFDPAFVTPGATYHFSNHYTATVTTHQIAQFGFADGTFDYAYLGEVPATDIALHVDRSITIPVGAETLTVFHELSAVGVLTVDDYSLVLEVTDTTAPVVTLTAPLANATVSGITEIAATALDDTAVAGVTFLVNGLEVGVEDVVALYTLTWDTLGLSNGVYTLSARARDTAGNIATTPGMIVTVNNPILTPNLILNPSLETHNLADEPEHWFQGGWGSNTPIFTYPVPGVTDDHAAKVEITSYTNGDAKWYFADVPVIPGETYQITHKYKSTVATEVIARFTHADGSHDYRFLGTPGIALAWTTSDLDVVIPPNVVSMTLFHVLNNVGSLEVDEFALRQIVIDTQAPTVTLSSPVEGETVSGLVAIDVTALDDQAVVGVTLLVNGVPTGTEDLLAPYTFNWDTLSLSNGVYTLSASARDTSGNIGTVTAPINVTVNNPTPTPNLILNPSLETHNLADEPESWFQGGWGLNTAIFTYPVPGATDDHAAKVEITSYTDGDAKWYFADVPVIPGETYQITHKYKSTVATEVVVRYTFADTTQDYQLLSAPGAASDWTLSDLNLVIPPNVVSMTLFHVLNNVGSLEVDEFELRLVTSNLILNPSLETHNLANEPENWFQGGWGLNTTIFTYPVPGATDDHAAKVEITSYINGDAKWYFADVPVIPGETYQITHKYKSTVATEVVVRYTFADTTQDYQLLSTPGTALDWTLSDLNLVIPPNVVSMTLFHVLNNVGSLEVDEFGLFAVPAV
jgi:glucose/arabinose dehydrogenase